MNDPSESPGAYDHGKAAVGAGIITIGSDLTKLWIFLLIVFTFIIQHYKIPTPSMEPTLVGHPAYGDCILVSKFHYHAAPINRFDVVVFKSPLDRTKNFVKRVVGLPGEEWMISRGDIYTRPSLNAAASFRLARKPLKAQQSLWFPMSSQDYLSDRNTFEQYWSVYPSKAQAPYQIHEGRLQLSPTPSDPMVRFSYLRALGHAALPGLTDLRIAYTFTLLSEPSDRTRFHSMIRNAHGDFELSIHPRRGTSTVSHKDLSGKVREWTVPLPPAGMRVPHELDFYFYDGFIGARFDGHVIHDQMIQSDFGRPASSSDLGQSIQFGAESASFSIAQLKLYRDLIYRADNTSESNFQEDIPVVIDPDSYLVLGDNVDKSQDSRRWSYYKLTLKNNRTFWCERNEWNRVKGQAPIAVTSIYGEKLTFDPEDLKLTDGPYPMRFLDRRLVVGKAILVYWNRLKFIH